MNDWRTVMVYEINAALFGRIRRMHDRFDALSDRIAEGFAEIDAAAAAARMQR
jgi:hypothetical protein